MCNDMDIKIMIQNGKFMGEILYTIFNTPDNYFLPLHLFCIMCQQKHDHMHTVDVHTIYD